MIGLQTVNTRARTINLSINQISVLKGQTNVSKRIYGANERTKGSEE